MELYNVQRIDIVKMFLYDTNTYHEQVSRPYEMYLQQQDLDNLKDRLHNLTLKAAGRLPAAQFAEAAATSMMPQTNFERHIPIVNGWNQKRHRFIMYVRSTNTLNIATTYIVSGYTDDVAVSDITGLKADRAPINENTQFIVNTITKVSEQDIPNGFGTTRQTVSAESNHVLANSLTMGLQQQPMHKLRPEDVFSSLTVQSSLGTGKNRTIANPGGVVSSAPSFSDCKHSISSNYMAKMVNGYSESLRAAQFGEELSSTLARTKILVQDTSAHRDPFISFIGKIHGTGTDSIFTLRDLKEVDPTCNERIKYLRIGSTLQTSNLQLNRDIASVDPRNTAAWLNSDVETKFATAISHAVPALCVESMISGISFECHNYAPGRQLSWGVDGIWALSMNESMMSVDLTKNAEMFRSRFVSEVLPAISFNNEIGIGVRVFSMVNSETRISISVDGKRPITFVTPSFADALLVPVTTTDHGRPVDLANKFETLIDNILPGQGISALSTYTDSTPSGIF